MVFFLCLLSCFAEMSDLMSWHGNTVLLLMCRFFACIHIDVCYSQICVLFASFAWLIRLTKKSVLGKLENNTCLGKYVHLEDQMKELPYLAALWKNHNPASPAQAPQASLQNDEGPSFPCNTTPISSKSTIIFLSY